MLKIITVGSIKEKYLKDGIEEYTKRLKKYTSIEIIELKDESFQDETKVKKTEGEKILKNIKDKDYVITLEIEGKQLTSVELAKKIDQIYLTNSDITFVIGGSLGLSDEVKARSNYALSFSKMTFPHQLFRLVLLEQIYRSYKINNNESYHK
ncbi:MAG: 23S rRNA (pseudouridine(1915)-N(3))-methyltransferase RlmH [Firmicutes bacterium]|nr:23S rRNA (pseudouridine(1915)-N(3))-methyltransferase RlmH [Bacillota bacterium]